MAVPTYVFNILKDGAAPERVEAELPNVAQAEAEAVKMIGAELRENPDGLLVDKDWRVEITDPRGLILFTVYSSAIQAAASRRD